MILVKGSQMTEGNEMTLGYSGAEMRLPAEPVQPAEALGFDWVWTAEAHAVEVAGWRSPVALGASTDSGPLLWLAALARAAE